MSNDIVRAIDISFTAPELPSTMILRPHLVTALTQIIGSDNDIICVEGPSGYGKTTFLREFCDTIEDPSFAIFLKPGSRLSYDPVMARVDLANQVHWQLTLTRLADNYEPTDGELRLLWSRCARYLIRRRQFGYIVVDGLSHIPTAESTLKKAIVNLLPLGVKPFKFIFSGDIDIETLPHLARLRVKPFPVMPFSPHETDTYLNDVVEQKSARAEYHTSLGGVPSFLASVRRQILSSAKLELDSNINVEADIESLFEAEWKLLQPLANDVTKALGYLIAFGRPVNLRVLSIKCGATEDSLRDAFDSLSFLTYSQRTGCWNFASDSLRTFAEMKLRGPTQEAIETLASELLRDPDSPTSLTELPVYLERAGKADALIEWLHEGRLAAIILQTHSAMSIEPSLRKAVAICREGTNDRALVTYSLCRSITQQLSRPTGMDDEIRARCSLGDIDGALRVANEVPLLTERVRLLAVLAGTKAESPSSQPEALAEHIQKLVSQIDITTLRQEDAMDLLNDLYPVDPKLALSLLREVMKSDIDESSFEVSIARMHLEAIRSKVRLRNDEDKHIHQPLPSDLAVDNKLRSLLEASTVFYQTKSGQEVLASTVTIEDVEQRLFIQRKWLEQNPSRDDAIEVTESAIHDAITAAQYTPNATFLQRSAVPLTI